MLLRVVAPEQFARRGVLLVPGIALVILQGNLRDGPPVRVGHARKGIGAPYGTAEIGNEQSPARVAAFRLPSPRLQDGQLFPEDGDPAPLDMAELQNDPLAIAEGLDASAKRRLLDFLLCFCGPAFRLGRSAPFAQTCRRLALDCVGEPGSSTVIAEILSDYVLVDQLRTATDASLVVIGHDRVMPSPVCVLEGNAGLQVVPHVDTGDLLVATGSALAVWRVTCPAPLRHILALPDKGAVPGNVARIAVRRALGKSASAQAQALLGDLDLLCPAQPFRLADPKQPVAGEVELAIPDCGGGMFVSGWLRDPLARVAELALETPAGRHTLTPGLMAQLRRHDVEARFAGAAHAGAPAHGVIVHVPDVNGGQALQPSLVLKMHSGAEIRLTPPARSLTAAAARDAVLGCVAPGALTADIMQRLVSPPTARLHAAAMARSEPPEVLRNGKAPADPPVSLVIPLYRNLGFLRLQIAALAQDPLCRRCEIIFVLDSPEQRGEAEHLLRGLHMLTDMATALVIMPRNLGYAAACNAGAAEATAPLLLLLNSDVIPAQTGWLATLAAPFESAAIGAAGPKLLFDDGSIQHAGLYFERDADGLWFNRHFHKGMPGGWPEAAVRRAVPGVTGAALMVRRALFETLGGICEDYIIGDYEDSDFCLRLCEAGKGILYVPQAELYHFERRSIQLHQGYTRTHASLYNRLLHHGRWDAAMEAAMTGPAVQAA